MVRAKNTKVISGCRTFQESLIIVNKKLNTVKHKGKSVYISKQNYSYLLSFPRSGISLLFENQALKRILIPKQRK
jgi:hypothetical protein